MAKRNVRPIDLVDLTALQRKRVKRGLAAWMAANREQRRPALERRKREQGMRKRAAKARGRALQCR